MHLGMWVDDSRNLFAGACIHEIDCYCCYHLSVIYETVAESFFVSKENQTSDHPQLLTWARYYSAGRRGDEG